MANSSVEPLWNLNATFDGIQVFNGTILYAEVDSQAAGGLFPGTSMMLNETSVSYNSTLNITFEESDYPTYILDQRGCRIGSADPDCPAACSNIDTLFDSLQTTYNCFLAPYVVAALQNPVPAVEDANAFSAAQLGFQKNSTVPDPVDNVIACFTNYCDAIEGCGGCDSQKLEELRGADRLKVLFDCHLSVCGAQLRTLDSDLGGIGVFISYIVQLVIAFLAFPLQLFLYTITTWTSHTTYYKKHRGALFSAYDEFHRAQCYFTGAIQIATIIVLSTDRLEYTGQTLQMNYEFVRVVAFNSIIAVTLTYQFLNRVTDRSRYRFGLTVVTFALACVNLIIVSQFAKRHSSTESITRVAECGNADLSAQCYSRIRPMGLESASSFWVLFPCSILMLHGIGTYFHPAYLVEIFTLWVYCLDHFDEKGFKWQLFRRDTAMRRQLQRFLPKILFGLSMILYVFVLATQLTAFENFYRGVDTSNWSIGQIAGITVWLSPILEFVQLEMAGMKYGFVHRLPSGYSIKHKQDTTQTRTLEGHANAGDRKTVVATSRSSSEDVGTESIELQEHPALLYRHTA